MVDIKIDGDNVIVEVMGIHQFWSLKRKIVFAKKNIIRVQLGAKPLRPAPFRAPGTYIPKLIIAGIYYGRKRKEFWDVGFKKDVIEIDLNNEKYTKIVVNVENPAEVMKLLQN